jgi:hypothetical protein
MHKEAKYKFSCHFSALGCALDQGRTAISMGRKTGNREDD